MYELIRRFKVEHTGYVNDIDNLVRFIRIEHEESCFDPVVWERIDSEYIRESIEWLAIIEHRHNYKVTARKYMFAIAELFRWLTDNGLNNTAIREQCRMESRYRPSYWYICDKYINSCDDLEISKTHDALSDDEVKDFIDVCNAEIAFSLDPRSRDDEVTFNNIVAAIIVKLVLLTGLRYRRIYNIPYTAYNRTEQTLRLEGIKISIPFARQLEQYLDMLQPITPRFLFVQYNHQPLPHKMAESALKNYLKKHIYCTSIEKIAKVGTQQLLRHKVLETIIRDISGVGVKTIGKCFSDEFDSYDWSDDINIALMDTIFYRYLSVE